MLANLYWIRSFILNQCKSCISVAAEVRQFLHKIIGQDYSELLQPYNIVSGIISVPRHRQSTHHTLVSPTLFLL